MCDAAINIQGEHFPCDWPTDAEGRHPGWAHSNRQAQAIWRGDLPDQSVVFEALGAVSACWDNLKDAGVFESDRAQEIGNQLVAYIKEVTGAF